MTLEEQRQVLVNQMLYATTEEEVDAAMRAAHAWLQKHPNDPMILSAGEQLVMMAEGLKLEKSTLHQNTA